MNSSLTAPAVARSSTHVDFWFDPTCPFSWTTSRWLNRVAPHRVLDITWQPFSLLIKNQIEPTESARHGRASRSHNLLRVVEAVRDAGHANRIGDLYTEFGRQIHHRDNLDFKITAVLEHIGLNPGFADALDEQQWDIPIRRAMSDGLALTGDDVGTPLIAIDGKHGRIGMFGPVITEVPSVAESVDLWDGFVTMVNARGFIELKRARTAATHLVDETGLDEQLPAVGGMGCACRAARGAIR